MPERDNQEADADARFAAALTADAPSVYFNGFVTRLSNGDIAVALERNGKPVAVLNLSYTVAKTLSVSLSQAIARLEELSGRDMLTSIEIDNMVTQKNDQGGESK